jgi:hypothetical protein
MFDCEKVAGKLATACAVLQFHAKSTLRAPSVGEQANTVVAPALWKAIVMSSPEANERF